MEDNAGKRMRAAALLMGASIALSRVLGFARDAILAAKMGASAETDAYLAAFLLPDLLNYFLAGGAVSLTFIPQFQEYWTRGERERAATLLSNVMLLTGGALLVAATAAFVFAAPLVGWLYPEFSAEQLVLTTRLTRVVLFGPVFFATGGFISATQQAAGNFRAGALSPLVYNLCIILGGLLLAPTMGIDGFSWGAMAGAVLGSLGVPLLAGGSGLPFRPGLAAHAADTRRYYVAALPIILGVSLLTVDDWYLRRLSSEPGAITLLNNARRLMLVPVGVVGQAAGVAALPFLSRAWASGDLAKFRELMGSALRSLTALSILAAASLFAAAQPLISLVYRRGAYSDADAASSASLLAIMAWASIGWPLQGLLLRGFYARAQFWTPMLVSSTVVVACYPLYASLEARWGSAGLAWAGVAGISAGTLALLILNAWKDRDALFAPLARGIGDGLTMAAVPTLICGVLYPWVRPGFPADNLQAGLEFVGMSAVYVLWLGFLVWWSPSWWLAPAILGRVRARLIRLKG